MENAVPPSGLWTGYYFYGHGGLKHRMRLTLTFARDGKIDGEGIDDIAPFVINGRFVSVTSEAHWTKAYVGMHSVEYFGFYSPRTICGDWTLGSLTGGFWIWPASLLESEIAEEEKEFEQPLALV
jgi:hypothetical protein